MKTQRTLFVSVLSAVLCAATATAGPYVVQEHYRWRNDDGNESGATWKQNEDVPHTDHVGPANIRLRLCIANTAAGYFPDANGWNYRLSYSTNAGGPYAAVPVTATTQPFEMTATANYTDGDSASQQITGSGTWTAGVVVEDPSNDSGLFDLAGGEFSNFEYCFQATTNAVGGVTYYFRLRNGAGDLDAYDQTAALTVITEAVVNNATGATGIDTNTATLNGQVVTTGGNNPEVRVYWGNNDGGTNAGSWDSVENLGTLGVGAFSTNVSGLSPNTQYFYRCYGSNLAGSAWAAATANFTTPAAPPAVLTLAASDVATNSATLNGLVTATGGDAPGVYVYWGATDGGTNFGSWDTDEYLGVLGAGAFSTNITGLLPGSNYCYRCYVTNSAQGAWAPSGTNFTTLTIVLAPTVTTLAASNVSTSSATLNGDLTSNGGEDPEVYIYRGTTDGGTSFGAWDTNEYLGVLSEGTFQAAATGLTPTVQYHYRCYATNSAGDNWAPASTSFWAVAPPIATNYPATGIATNSAQMNGEVLQDGGTNVSVYIYWGTTDGGPVFGSWDTNTFLGVRNEGTFSTNISGLTPGTQYFYRAWVENIQGGAWAAPSESFWTVVPPAVTNDFPTGVTTSQATLNGRLLETGGQDPEVHVFWGNNDGNVDAGLWDNDVSLGTLGVTNFSTVASNLLPGTVYYFRSYGTNAGGASWAPGTTVFVTSSGPPPYGGADLLDESFDGKTGQSPPSGWTTDGTPTVNVVSSNAIAIDEDELMVLSRSGQNEGVRRTFGPVTSGDVVVEWAARVDVSQNTFFFVRGSGGQRRIRVRFHTNGQIQYRTTAGWLSLLPYSTDTWYRFRLEIDEDAGTCDLYVNNVQEAASVTLENAGTGIGQLQVNLRTQPSTVLVDDVEVYTHKKWVGGSSTNWNAAANWAPNGAPGAGDDVRITDGDQLDGRNRQPAVTSAAAAAALLLDEINDGSNAAAVTNAVLSVTGANSLDVNGQITVETGGTLQITSTGSLVCAGDFDNGGTFDPGAGSTEFDGDTTLKGTSSWSFNNITVTDTLKLAATGTVSIAGDLSNNGTLLHNSATTVFGGNTVIDGSSTSSLYNVTVTGSLTGHSSSMEIAGNWDSSAGVYSNNSGTVVLNGTASQMVRTGGAYNPATTNNNWKNNWYEIVVSNASPAGVIFADGFKTTNFTCTTPGAALHFRYQEGVTNVFEIVANGGLNIQGATNQLVTLRRYGGADAATNRWEIYPHSTGGVWTVSYVDVSYSVNSAPSNNYIYPTASVDSGYTVNWFLPTLVTLSWFEAIGRSNSVSVRWKTHAELNNAGFNVYRSPEAGGTYTRVNSALMPGLGRSSRGSEYVLVDAGIVPGTTNYYRLEYVEFDGTSEIYGPTAAYPDDADGDGMTDDWEQFYGLNAASNDAAGDKDGDLISNYDEYLADTNPDDPDDDEGLGGGQEPVWPAGDSGIYKVFVEDDGIYRLTHAYLKNTAGITNIGDWVLDNVRLYSAGSEIPLRVHNEGPATFGTNDYVEFAGIGLDTRFTARNVYWLYHAANAGLRMPEIAGPPSGKLTTNYLHTEHFEQNEWYQEELSDDAPDDDHFFLNVFLQAPDSTDQFPVLTDVSPVDTSAVVRVALRNVGYTASHNVQVQINGNALPDDSWTGDAEHVYAATTAQSNLTNNAANTVTVTLPPPTNPGPEQILIDHIEIDYVRDLVTTNDSLTFTVRSQGSNEYRVTGITTNDLHVFRVSGSTNVVLITNITISIPSNTVVFSDNTVSGVTYMVVGPQARKTPAAIVEDSASNLRSTTNRADYIIIAYDSFAGSMVPLVTNYQAQGMQVKLVNVSDVYDDFSFGVITPYAIRDFLSYARSSWRKPAPAYVLLVGAGTYDYRNYEDMGFANYIPVKMIHDVESIEAASDNWFVCLDGDDDIAADMYVGRFPARSTDDVDAMVNRTLAYRNNTEDLPWKTNVLVIADAADQRFEDICESALAHTSGYTSESVYYRTYSGNKVACRTAITDALNAGALVALYAGHGHIEVWSDGILRSSDVASLTNSARLPFMVTPTCMNGSFTWPPDYGLEPMAEELLTRSGGAVACLSPSGMSSPPHQQQLVDDLFDTVFGDGTFRLGPAVARAKLKTRSQLGEAARIVIRTFILFGDPALSLKHSTPVQDQTSPEITNTVPAGLAAVHLPSSIRIDFSEAMDDIATRAATDISPATPGALRWEENTLVFEPHGQFDRTATYTFSVSSNACDLAGNRLTNDFVLSFTPARVTMSGTISNVTPSVGPVHLSLFDYDPLADADAFLAGQANGPYTDVVKGVGPFGITNLPSGPYWPWAYVDANTNGAWDAGEAMGQYPTAPVNVGTGDVTGIDIVITLFDSDQDGLPDYVEDGSGVFVSAVKTGTKNGTPDTDADGLTDLAEVTQHFTDPNRADTDDDGMDDRSEIIAGTSATNPLEVFEIGGVDVPSSNTVTLSIIGRSNRVYTLWMSTGLLAPAAWTNLEERSGAVGVVTFTNTTGEANCYYRIDVRLAP